MGASTPRARPRPGHGGAVACAGASRSGGEAAGPRAGPTIPAPDTRWARNLAQRCASPAGHQAPEPRQRPATAPARRRRGTRHRAQRGALQGALGLLQRRGTPGVGRSAGQGVRAQRCARSRPRRLFLGSLRYVGLEAWASLKSYRQAATTMLKRSTSGRATLGADAARGAQRPPPPQRRGRSDHAARWVRAESAAAQAGGEGLWLAEDRWPAGASCATWAGRAIARGGSSPRQPTTSCAWPNSNSHRHRRSAPGDRPGGCGSAGAAPRTDPVTAIATTSGPLALRRTASSHRAGWKRRATGRQRHQITRPESERETRTGTAPDTPRDRSWAAAMSRKVRGMIEGVSDLTE